MIQPEFEVGGARDASTTTPHGPLLSTIPARRNVCDTESQGVAAHAQGRGDCQLPAFTSAQLSITSHPGNDIHGGLIDGDGSPFSQSAMDHQQTIARRESEPDNKDHLGYSLISLMSNRELGSSLTQHGSAPNVRPQGTHGFSARPPVSPPAHPVRHPNPLSMWSTRENHILHQQFDMVRNYSHRHRLPVPRHSPVPANQTAGGTPKQTRLPDPVKWRTHLATLSTTDANELVQSTYETLYGIVHLSEALSAIINNTQNATPGKGSPEAGPIRPPEQSTSDFLLRDFLLPRSSAEEDQMGGRGGSGGGQPGGGARNNQSLSGDASDLGQEGPGRPSPHASVHCHVPHHGVQPYVFLHGRMRLLSTSGTAHLLLARGDSANPLNSLMGAPTHTIAATLEHQYSTTSSSSLASLARQPIPDSLKAPGAYIDDAGFTSINQYSIMEEIGRGMFGKVYLAVDLADNSSVAIKVMDCGVKVPKHRFRLVARPTEVLIDEGGVESSFGGRSLTTALESNSLVLREIAIMKRLNHKNIVMLKEVIHDEEEELVYMVMQYVDNGPIAKVNEDGTCGRLTVEQVRSFLRQAATGLQYLHNHGIIHRDIKPENILHSSEGVCCLADFGVSAVVREGQNTVDFAAGTQTFFSPEMCRGRAEEVQRFAKESDIWALGVTFYAVRFGRLPFFSTNVLDLCDKIQNSPLTFPDDECPADDPLRELLSRMLAKDPKDRISLSDIRKEPYLKPDAVSPPVVDRDRDTLQLVSDGPSAEDLRSAVRRSSRRHLFQTYLHRYLSPSSSETELVRQLTVDPGHLDLDTTLPYDLRAQDATDGPHQTQQLESEASPPASTVGPEPDIQPSRSPVKMVRHLREFPALA